MTTPTPGDQFIRTLRHYLEANKNRLLLSPSQQPQAINNTGTVKEEPVQQSNGLLKAVSSLWSSNIARHSAPPPSKPYDITHNSNSSNSGNSRPSSLYGIPIPYMSLLANTSPNVTSLNNTPYMPIRSSLTLDIHYLYFLLVQFDYLGLEDNELPVPEGGLVETETTQTQGQTPSIMSVGSMMSTLSLGTGWQFWSNNGNSNTHEARPLHEDIVYIHRYLQKVTALKLHMSVYTSEHQRLKSGQRTIKGYETPPNIPLPLTALKNLQFLELSHIHPRLISNWEALKDNLVSLTIKLGNVDNAMDVIGNSNSETEWEKLKMLSLSNNSLTTIDAEATALIKNISHLNLSSNLLIDIPSALATLYNLSSLNLSYNMISFTTGINTILGNIQELDLRGNRLTLLAGLDRLWALERLDVRDNRIDDQAEIGRLTSLPNVQDIWIEGNPFTKLQVDYRIHIFNVFKKNDQDIQLDGTKPSFNERRHIHSDHHVGATTPSATVINNNIPPQQQKWPTATAATITASSNDIDETAVATALPKTNKLARAKSKSNKRVIRLGSQAIDSNLPIQAVLSDDEDTKKYVHRLAELEETVQQEQVVARRAASVRSRRSNKSATAKKAHKEVILEEAEELEKSRRSSDAFRRKIEAMRREAGTEWLRVLQEMDVGTIKRTVNTPPVNE